MLSVVDRAGSDVISGGLGGVRCYQWWAGRGQMLSVVYRTGSDVISGDWGGGGGAAVISGGQGGVRCYQWWTGRGRKDRKESSSCGEYQS